MKSDDPTMKLDPFPPPSDKLCEHFGRTSYYTQKFERELKLFLLACHESGRIRIDVKKFVSAEDFLDGKTLGQLWKQLKDQENRLGQAPDLKFHADMKAAVDDRNFLFHKFFQNWNPLRASAPEEEAAFQRLGRIRLSVGNAFLVMREFRKQAERELGVTEEQIEEILRKAEGDNSKSN